MPSSVRRVSRLRSPVRRGFTLVELLLVVVVIGIIAAIALPEFTKARTDTMDGRREADMRNVEKALEAYFSRHSRYPTTGGQWWGDAPSYGGKEYSGPNAYIPGLVPDFIKGLPRDPDQNYPNGARGYLYRSNGVDYKFLAHYTPTTFSADHPLYDPRRPNHSWQISSFGARNW